MKSDDQLHEQAESVVEEIEEQEAAQATETVEGNAELEHCQKELTQWKDQATRIFADFENFKKRTEREQAQWMQVAQTSVLKDLLSMVDDFDRALAQKTEDTKDLYAGIEMIYASLVKVLKKYDVKEFESYQTFDPELHEALMRVDSPDHEEGQIVQVLEKGFMCKETVLRPAKVSVAK